VDILADGRRSFEAVNLKSNAGSGLILAAQVLRRSRAEQ
jgi:hypothetical protein